MPDNDNDGQTIAVPRMIDVRAPDMDWCKFESGKSRVMQLQREPAKYLSIAQSQDPMLKGQTMCFNSKRPVGHLQAAASHCLLQ